MRRERLYLEDIIDSIEKIQSFTVEMDFNSFIRDNKTKSAVIREFEIIRNNLKVSKRTNVSGASKIRREIYRIEMTTFFIFLTFLLT